MRESSVEFATFHSLGAPCGARAKKDCLMLNLNMKPTGWFHIGWGAEIPPGGVKPLRYFGQDLVAFRSAGGVLSVLDAHCRHLGAPLGSGGEGRKARVVCPYTGWGGGAGGAGGRAGR